MTYKTFEWGVSTKLPLRSIVDKKKIRILSLPVGDYTGETIREVLEATLNDGAFTGSIPEGSGQQYVVEGTGTEVRIRLGDVDKPGSDRFAILPENYLTNIQSTLQFPDIWSPDNTNSLNGLLGNLVGDAVPQANSDIDFTATYITPTPYPTPTHLAGIWEAAGVNLRFVRDVDPRSYSVRSPNGIHLRSFTISTTPNPTQTTVFNVTADEYQLANKAWEDDVPVGTIQFEYSMSASRAPLFVCRVAGIYWTVPAMY